MTTPTILRCPACRTGLKVPGAVAGGQRIRCPKCGTVFAPGDPSAADGSGTVAVAPSAQDTTSERAAAPTPCPDVAVLRRLLLGELAPAELRPIAAHVLRCPHCTGTLSGLRAGGVEPTVPLPAAGEAFMKELSRWLASLAGPGDATSNAAPAAAGTGAAAPGLPERLGPYRLLQVLGKGGMGLVYEAEDTRLKRHVALKVMLPQHAANDQARRRFLREAQAQAALEHDHVVAIHAADEDQGVPYIAMPLLRGETLADCLGREGRLELAEVLRIGRETAEGLAAAHERGLIHRDIKPSNLWLEGRKRRVKILDFGLARAAQIVEDAQLTGTGVALGTPAYMSPEQALGEPVDTRSDLFSLGSVLYQLTTGSLPFQGKSITALLAALATRTPAPPRTLNAGLPSELDELIMRLLARSAADRPESAAAVAGALAALERTALAQAPTEAVSAPAAALPVAVPVPVPVPAAAPARHRPRRALLIVGGILLLVGGGLLLAQAVIRIVNKDGSETRIEVPRDAAVIVEKDGKPVAKVVPPRKKPPAPVAPPPVVVPVGAKINFAAERTAAEKLLELKKGRFFLADPNGNELGDSDALGGKLPDTPFYVRSVQIGGCDLTDDAAAIVAACGCLEYLDLSHNPKLTDRSVASLKSLPHLANLQLTNTGISDEAMKALANAPALQGIFLFGTKVTDQGLQELRHCPRLRTLHAPDSVTDESLVVVARHCRELREVQFHEAFKASLRPLAGLPRLRSVRCPGSYLTDEGVAILARFPFLDRLVITPPSPAGLVERLRPLAGKVRSLEFASYYHWDEGIPADAWAPLFAFPGLEELSIGGLKHGVDGSVFRKGAAMRDLRSLSVSVAKPQYAPEDVAAFRQKRPDVKLAIHDGKTWTEYPPLAHWPKGPDGSIAAWDLPRGAPPPAVAPFSPDEAKKHQEAWATFLKQPVEVENKLGMRFRLIPPGESVGPPVGVVEPTKERVLCRLTKPYFLGVTEVTNEQFEKFVTATGYKTDAERSGLGGSNPDTGFVGRDPKYTWRTPRRQGTTPKQPVTQLTWGDMMAFCEWLGEQDGAVYRLPSQAEWRFACRAGGGGKLGPTDNPQLMLEYGWFNQNEAAPESPVHEVAQKKANAFGLYDTYGNVSERFIDGAYPGEHPTLDPLRSTPGNHYQDGSYVVDWAGVPEKAWACDPSHCNGYTGFRVLRQTTKDPVPPPEPFGTPVLLARGEALSPQAAVSRPAPIKGVRSWSVEFARSFSYAAAIAWSPRGDLIAAADLDFRVLLWDRDGHLKRVLLGHTGQPSCLSFSPDGKWLACGDRYGGEPGNSEVRVWNVETGACVRVFPTPGWVHGVSFAPNGRDLLVYSNSLQRIDVETGARVTAPEALAATSGGPPIHWSADGKWPLGNQQGRAVVLDGQTLKVAHRLTCPDDPGNGASVGFPVASPDGKWLAAVGSDKKVRLWDARTREYLRTNTTAVEAPVTVAWHPKAPRLAVSGGGPIAWEVLDATDGRSVARCPHRSRRPEFAWSPDGGEITMEGASGLLFYDAARGKRMRETPNHGFYVALPTALSPDGKQLLCGSVVLDAATGTPLRRLERAGSWIMDAAWSPHGDVVALTGHSDQNVPCIWLYDPATGKRSAEIEAKDQWNPRLHWSPDGKQLATQAEDGSLTLWDVPGRKTARHWALPKDAWRFAWSPDGTRIAVAGREKGLQLWDPATGKLAAEYRQFPLPNGRKPDVTACAWSLDGRDVWLSSGIYVVRVDTRTGRMWPPEPFTNGNVADALFPAPDGDHLLVTEKYNWSFLRDHEGGRRLLGQFLGSATPIFSGDQVWHPDARRFICRGQLGIRGFDTRRGDRLGTLYPWSNDTDWLVIGPDGHWRGSDGIGQHIVYVAMLEDGSQRTYTPAEFAKEFGWRNDPQKARLLQLDP